MSLVVNDAHDNVFSWLHISGPCDECSPKNGRLVKHRHHALLTEINDVLFKPLSFSDVIRGTYIANQECIHMF